MLKKHSGEFYLLAGAVLFSFNGVVITVALDHMTAYRLAQTRSIGAFVLLFLFTYFQDRQSLSATKKEIPTLMFYGIFGYAMVQLGYLIGISQGVPLSLVLIIEFTAPIWIVLWIKFVRKGAVANQMWLAIFLSLTGLILVAKAWEGLTFDLFGVLGALGAALALAVYFLMSENQGKKRNAQAMAVFGFGFSALFWCIVLPVWNYPFDALTTSMNLQGRFDQYDLPGWAVLAFIIVFGTLVPYLLVINGIRRLSASTSSVIGMSEPVLAGAFAWIWLSQGWSFIQLLGGGVVLVGIYIADRAKTSAI